MADRGQVFVCIPVHLLCVGENGSMAAVEPDLPVAGV